MVALNRMSLGIYISVPFCRSKCSFCNFASGVFSREKMSGYVARVREEIVASEALARRLEANFERKVDSVYLGGGTPTTLSPEQLRQLFRAVYESFDVRPAAEVTIECAPGTLRPNILEALLDSGVNRVSLGTQSFIDEEIKSVGRLHTAEQALSDISVLREHGIRNLNLDLIAGLPHQNAESWRVSLQRVIESDAPHVSVYMLEIDEDSRLGRELLAGGTRYHAHHVPDPDLSADMYLEAIDCLSSAGLMQYEISNFARPGSESRHNLRYWIRQPYLGFGLDAHSMLAAAQPSEEFECVRFGNPDDLEAYLADSHSHSLTQVSQQEAAEESMFLGLRLNDGIDLLSSTAQCFEFEIRELAALGLVEQIGNRLRLTARGRLLSNEVLERFVVEKVP
jgi:oxygen-independent coproporphyrinogen-3 oxidase